MSIAEKVLDAVSTTALVIGSIVLIFLVCGLIWLISVWYQNWSYKRYRARKHDVEWDNVRSAWIDEYIHVDRRREHHTDTLEWSAVDPDRVETDVFPEITPEAIINYQNGPYRDAS